MSENKSLTNVNPEENKLNNSLEDKDKDKDKDKDISNTIQILGKGEPSEIKEEIKDEIEILDDKSEQKSASDSIVLRLGDIIMIQSSQNEILDNNVFLIEYIDPSKVKLINSENFEKVTLSISPDGIIGDGSIESIKVISSNPDNGFARQNELLPGKWVNIYFGGDIPVVITGKIVNLEEDMIEIKTTDDDTLFIDFKYQGVPEDIPIETFEIRPAISKRVDVEDELVELGEEESIEEEVMNKPIIKQKIQKIKTKLVGKINA